MPRKNTIDDAPEWTAAMFQAAVPFTGLPVALQQGLNSLKKRGRPKTAQTKQEVKLRIDADVLAAFKAGGAGWQTRMNQVLKQWVESNA